MIDGIGGGNAAAAAAAAARARAEAEARRRAEEARRKAAEAARAAKARAEQARKAAAAAQKQAKAAAAAAEKAKAAAANNKSQINAQAQVLERGNVTPAARIKAAEKATALSKAQPKLELEAKKLAEAAEAANKTALAEATKALTAEKAANAAALAICEKQPYELANNVVDVVDAASLTNKEQAQLFGRRAAVPPEEAARADAVRIQEASKGGIKNTATAIADALEQNHNVEYKKALVEAVTPQIVELGKQISKDDGRPSEDDMKHVLSELSRGTERAGRDASAALATAFAQEIPDHDLDIDDGDRLGGALKSVVSDGAGSRFGVELSSALTRAGKGEAAEEAAKATAEGIEDLTKEFNEAAAQNQKNELALGRLIKGFGATIPPEKQKQAIEAFRARHQDDTDKFNELGAKMGNTLKGVGIARELTGSGEQVSKLKEVGEKALEQLPMIGYTEGGKEAIRRAVGAQSRGEHTFLDGIDLIAGKQEDPEAFRSTVADHLTTALGVKAMRMAAEGDKAGAAQVIEKGLLANSEVMGFTPETMEKISKRFADVLAGKQGASEALEQEIAIADGRTTAQRLVGVAATHSSALLNRGAPPDAKPSVNAQRLSALGLSARIIGNAGQWKNFKDADALTKAVTVNNSVDIGATGAKMLMETFGAAEKFGSVTKLLGRVNLATGVVSAGVDAARSVNAFKEGDVAMGSAMAVTAAGQATLAGIAISAGLGAQVVPGVGTAIGAALLAGGIAAQFAVGHFAAKKAEHEDEADTRAFLEAGGFSETAAEELGDLTSERKNMGPFLNQIAPQLGVTPEELAQHLNGLDGDKLESLVKMAHDLKQEGDADNLTFAETADSDSSYMTSEPPQTVVGGRGGVYVVPRKPESLTAAAHWMRENGLAPTPTRIYEGPH